MTIKMMEIWRGTDLPVHNWHEEFALALTNLHLHLYLHLHLHITNFHFNGLLLTKVHNVWTKNSMEELCLIAQKIDAKFEGKLTCPF